MYPQKRTIKYYLLSIYIPLMVFGFQIETSFAQTSWEDLRHQIFDYQVADAPSVQNVNDLFYVRSARAKLYATNDSLKIGAPLRFRETVQVLRCEQDWCWVRRNVRQEGYVYAKYLSNLWLRAVKSSGRLYLYQGATLVKTFAANFGTNEEAHFKTQRSTLSDKDQWITPEGLFYIAAKNDQSEYYKALIISYPNVDHARKGMQNGVISRQEFESIKSANENFRVPSMTTALGGKIEIHGNGTSRRINWTRGCIALRDLYMDDLWDVVQIGTPILIEP